MIESFHSLILLRGLPGSGKSSLAESLSENGKYPVYSVDDFFTDKITGAYKFEFEKNHMAYKACEENVKKAMNSGIQKFSLTIHLRSNGKWKPILNSRQDLITGFLLLQLKKDITEKTYMGSVMIN